MLTLPQMTVTSQIWPLFFQSARKWLCTPPLLQGPRLPASALSALLAPPEEFPSTAPFASPEEKVAPGQGEGPAVCFIFRALHCWSSSTILEMPKIILVTGTQSLLWFTVPQRGIHHEWREQSWKVLGRMQR